jgi:lantibiotic modifying enzyme
MNTSKKKNSILLSDIELYRIASDRILKLNNDFEIYNYDFELRHSLFSGTIGFNLFYFYTYQTLNLETSRQKYFEEIRKLIYSLDFSSLPFSFSNGYFGFFWALKHLENNESSLFYSKTHFDENQIYEQINSFVSRDLEYDYLHGLLGIVILFVEAKKYNYLNGLVDYINFNSIKINDKMVAFKSIDYHSSNNSYIFDLGLSHGIPSIITIISYIYGAGIAKEKCLKLLNGSISWLLQQKLPEGSLSIFPYSVPVEKPENYQPAPSRLAWCYGDLGIARSLWLAGKATGNETWKNEAVQIMLHASKRRNLEENRVYDAGLCHGSAGIAHIFNRFYQDTQIEDFKEAALYWYKVTLNFATHEDGIGGYKMFVPAPNDNEEGTWENSAGLLEGSAGIGLALLAAISDEEPKWDRCLLLS